MTNPNQNPEIPPEPGAQADPWSLALEARVFLEYMAELGLNNLGVNLPSAPKILPPIPPREISPASPKATEDFEPDLPPFDPSWANDFDIHYKPVTKPASKPLAGPKLDPLAAKTIADFNQALKSCQNCFLARAHKVLGQGPLNPPLMIVLEPPETDDLWPAGEAGELLGKIITGGLKLQISEVYVTRVLKCQPQNPDYPLGAAKKKCFDLILKEISLINPKAILAFGDIPGQILTQSIEKMFFLRQKPYILKTPQPIPLQVTLSLILMLEEPELKKEVFGDLWKAKRLAKLI
ncbi:MAG: hypothetical protein LBT38_11665 [Deltaproteobacteria bacterium]|nr:hypothetical protein [Deltaproteobacteria bacterium]